MDAAEKALGLTDAQLQQSLQSGATLSDLAAKQGVSEDSLVSTIARSLQENAPAGSSSSSTDYTSPAQNIVQGATPHRHGGHRAHAGSSGSDSGTATGGDDPFGTAAGPLGVSQDDRSTHSSRTAPSPTCCRRGLSVNDLTNALGTTRGSIVDTPPSARAPGRGRAPRGLVRGRRGPGAGQVRT